MSMDLFLHLQDSNPSTSSNSYPFHNNNNDSYIPTPSLACGGQRWIPPSQHASNNPSPTTPTAPFPLFFHPTTAAAATVSPFKGTLHRRALSEGTFVIHDDMVDPCIGFSFAPMRNEGVGLEDDLFSTYIDVEKLSEGGSVDGSGGCGNGNDKICGGGEEEMGNNGNLSRRRNSIWVVDDGEVAESKKAMPPDKLAELWVVDPKRAKRIMANRQSAARSKERRARYIQELERRVNTLQTEATSLATQVKLYQRDTTGLAVENEELQLRLQSMEQQAQLCNALNEALREEVERLKFATGEKIAPSESSNARFQHILYNPSSSQPAAYPQLSQSNVSESHQNMPWPLFQSPQCSISPSDIWGSNNIGRNREYSRKEEGDLTISPSSISASACESSSTTNYQPPAEDLLT